MRFKPPGVRQINDPGSAIAETAPVDATERVDS
jgi:hypothetical protein